MERPRNIGPDRVHQVEGRLVIHSRADMEHWQVLRYRKPLIHHDGRTWTLVSKESAADGMICYELEPWAPEAMERPGHEIHYGAEYIEQRERQLAIDRASTVATPLVWIATPLIGLLWSGTRRRLELYGIDPVASVRSSVFSEYLLLVMALAYCTVLFLVGALGHAPPLPLRPGVVLVLVLIPDALIRYGSLLGEERYPPGFYQWLWLLITTGRSNGRANPR